MVATARRPYGDLRQRDAGITTVSDDGDGRSLHQTYHPQILFRQCERYTRGRPCAPEWRRYRQRGENPDWAGQRQVTQSGRSPDEGEDEIRLQPASRLGDLARNRRGAGRDLHRYRLRTGRRASRPRWGFYR